MPISKKRKKKGKVVKNSSAKRVDRLENVQSGVTLQDLINTLAYQEYEKQGVFDKETMGGYPPAPVIVDEIGDGFFDEVAEDVVVNFADNIPVTWGQGDEKRVVGTATPIPGAEEKTLSINITDPELLAQVKTQADIYSIYSEEQE